MAFDPSSAGSPGAAPLDRSDARELIRSICDEGEVVLTRHAKEESLPNRGLDVVDVMNILRAGHVAATEWDSTHQSYKYTVATHHMEAVVVVVTETLLKVVTVYRK